MGLNSLSERWVLERPDYELLCQKVETSLKVATQQRGIPCEITSRAKAIDSFLKKVLRKAYENAYDDVQDKAGVRITCTYQDYLPQLEEIVRELFVECDYDNKSLDLKYDELGYPGIHFQVRLRPKAEESVPQLDGKTCEIQLLTQAQGLWANVSHDLVYKASLDPPDPIKRLVYHQVALVGIFDNQMSQARKESLCLPGFHEGRMLEELEKHFYRFTAERFDRELSLLVLGTLRPLFADSEIERFSALVDQFVQANKDGLEVVYKDYAEDCRRSPLLFQPEAIAIFMCLERNTFALKENWSKALPLDLLKGLADIWAVDIGAVP